MRGSYFFFITVLFCIGALAYLIARPQRLTPETERLIREAVREAVAEAHRTAPERVSSAEGVQQIVDEVVAQYMNQQAALQQDVETHQRYLGALQAEASAGRRALEQVMQNAEARRIISKRDNREALIADALHIVEDARAWKLKPVAFGGGYGNDGFNGLTFESLSRKVSEDSTFSTLSGTFRIEPQGQHLRVTGRNEAHGNQVTIIVTGAEPAAHTIETEDME